MNRSWMIVAALLVVGSSGCGSTGLFGAPRYKLLGEAQAVKGYAELPHELKKGVLENYVLEPGDGLLVLPADLDSPVRIASDQTILSDGTIDLGKYGQLLAAGKTVTTVESELNDIVKKQAKDAGFIDVRLINRQSKVYYVQGEVNNPGSFPLAGRETVLDALVAAGGSNDRASVKNIILVRPGCEVLAIDFNRIVQLGQVETNYQLMPGDRIFVPSKTLKETISETLHPNQD